MTETIESDNLHIDDFLELYAGDGINYMSIDIAGVDYAVLKPWTLTASCRPSYSSNTISRASASSTSSRRAAISASA